MVVAIIAALAVPSRAGRRVQGTASRIPVEGPPQVGECLLTDPSGSRSVLDHATVEIFAAQTGPCGGQNCGEVVSVTLDACSFPVTVGNRLSHSEPMACNPLIRVYLGWPAGDISNTDGRTAGAWRAVVTDRIGLIGPNLWQYLGRQNWLACVVYPRFGRYAGSVGRSFADRGAADAFALCLRDAGTGSQQSISCALPHPPRSSGGPP